MSEIRNPNTEPGGDNRMMLALGIMVLTFLFSFQLFKPAQKPAGPVNPVAQQKAGTPQGAAAPSAAAPASTSVAVAAPQTKQAAGETETIVENDLYRITFTNRGAQVKSWILKKHESDAGKPLDMVEQRAAEQYGYPLSLFTYEEGLRNKLNTALYVPSATGESKAPQTVIFEYADGDTTVHKSFSFDHSYVVKINTSVTYKGANVAAYPSWPAGLGDQRTGPQFASSKLEWFHDDKIERKAAQEGFFFKSHIGNGETINGPFYWAAVSDQFFAAVFLPDQPSQAAMVEFHNTIPRNPDEKDEEKKRKETFSVLGAAVGNTSAPTSLRLFVGPKNLDALKSVRANAVSASLDGSPAGPNIEGVVDFGTFGIIAKPLFLWLNWTHDHMVANWGWAIIILTVIINVVLFPMRFTGMKSALKQQKIAPELKQINYKYRDLKITDPRQAEKQKEIQELMKREGINQMAGCLPTLIQFPFLIAFYTMLGAANELRHAHWLWVRDLSSPDPLYILPAAIFVSMFVMQRITPMTGMDPQQAQMMRLMMPLVIGAISFTLPAGLGVYWVTGNIIGFFTQYLMNNTKHAREIREHLAKREAKKRKS